MFVRRSSFVGLTRSIARVSNNRLAVAQITASCLMAVTIVVMITQISKTHFPDPTWSWTVESVALFFVIAHAVYRYLWLHYWPRQASEGAFLIQFYVVMIVMVMVINPGP